MRLVNFIKKAFLILCFLASKTVYSDKLQYHLTQSANSSHLTIELEAILDKSAKEIKFDVPSYFWGTNVKDQIRNIKLLTKNAQLSIDEKQNQLIISNFSGKKIKLQYELHDTSNKTQHYAPKVAKDNFSFLGNAALITPIISNADEKHEVSFAWSGFKEPVLSNFAVAKNNTVNANISIKDLQNSFFINGKTRAVGNFKNIKVVIKGKLPVNERMFIKKIQQILEYQDKFFQGDLDNKDSVFIIADDDFRDNHGGVRLGNFNVLLISSKIKLDHLLYLASHERLHKWFGGLLKQDIDNQGKYKWFMEGFTDYYTYYLNYLSGTIGFAEYLKSYNDCLQEYFSSPVFAAENSIIAKNYWNSGQLSRLAYLRGRIFAHELNYKIKQLTNNEKNLDDVVRLMVTMSHNQIFTDEFFINSIQKAANFNISPFLQKQIYLGKLNIEALDLQDKAKGKATLIKKDIQVADYGFDFVQSFAKNKVIGLMPKSNAYRAGLRNGQTLYGAWLNGLDKTTTLEIKSSSQEQTIKYTPNAKIISVPEYMP
jgi:predicted metalloprotease with PDZ domain